MNETSRISGPDASGGQLRVDLITDGDAAETAAGDMLYGHDERYAVVTTSW